MKDDKNIYKINLQHKSNKNNKNDDKLYVDYLKVFSAKISSCFESLFPVLNEFNRAISKNMNNFKALVELLDTFEKIGFDEFIIKVYKESISKNRLLINRFRDETIFPPINFIADNDIQLDKDEDLLEWILSSDVKSYYISKIQSWKYKYEDESVKGLIDEVKVAFDNNLNCSISLSICMLIERMLREEIFEKEGSISYKKIKNTLKNSVFNAIEAKDLYEAFIKNNLYCSTNKAIEFSRHMVHGIKIEQFTEKTAMNMILIYDFLQELIIFHTDED